MEQYIPKAAVVEEINKRIMEAPIDCYGHQRVWAYNDVKDILDTFEVKEINENPEPAYRSKIIKVKCISPFDETWEKGKVYICEKWHHGDLNMDFWDVYYDYGSNPIYVQFSSVEMLEKEFAILRNDTLEAKEVNLEEEINKYISDNFFGSQTLGFFANRTKEEPNDEDIALVAKHFFELGLKVQKGE